MHGQDRRDTNTGVGPLHLSGYRVYDAATKAMGKVDIEITFTAK
jgi:hypothetical protein